MYVTVEEKVKPISGYERWGKRALDVTVSVLAMLVLSPVMVICVAAVRMSSPGPILFRHTRVGRHGREFKIVKFRTMSHSGRPNGPNLTVGGDPRITFVGRYLRKYKLDELPQFFNVLWGDMSIVGPRPEVAEYVLLYTKKQREILSLRPGITGAASVAYHNEEEELRRAASPHDYYVGVLIPRKLDLDLSYAKQISFSNDLRLMLATLGSVLGGTRMFGGMRRLGQ